MKHRLRLCCAIIIAVLSILNPVAVFAQSDEGSDPENYLDIATVESRPISGDRLVYTAFKDIGVNAVFTTAQMQAGYSLANDGDKDGVVAATPNIDEIYPNLVKVPVPLERVNLNAYIREGSDLSINTWGDLSGLRVGINTQRPYIKSNIPSGAKLFERDTVDLLFDGLIGGDYDVVVSLQGVHETLGPEKGVVQAGLLEYVTEYLYLNKKHEYLVPDVSESLRVIFADGRGKNILNDVTIPDANRNRTLLHVYSYNMQLSREEQLNARLREPFENEFALEWYTVELNSRRFHGDAGRLAYFADLLRRDFVSRDLAAIVVSGDEALDFIKNYYYLYFRNVPVLFYGVSDTHGKDLTGLYPDFTGIVEHLPIYETVSLGLELFPKTRKIFVVNGFAMEGSIYRSEAQRQLEPFSDAVDIEYNNNVGCDTLIEQIKGLPSDSLVFFGSYFRDAKGQYYPPNEMRRLLDKNCDVPILSVYSTNLGYNAIGGKALDYEKFGEAIAEMLERVLKGESLRNMPPIDGGEGFSRWVFDKIMLDRTGAKESDLPPGSIVINKVPSIWESNPGFAFSLVALVLLGISAAGIISVIYIRYLKQKDLLVQEEKTREIKERLERIINTAPVAFMMTVDGVVVDSNEYIEKYIGVKKGCRSLNFYADPSQRQDLLGKVRSHESVESHVVKYKMLTGSDHRFLSNVSSIDYEGHQGFILWAMDIEERERQKDKIHTAQIDMQTILNTMPVAVGIRAKTDGSLVYTNKAWLEMFGFDTFEDVARRSILDFMPEIQPNGEKTADMIEWVNTDSEVTMEFECLKSTGEAFYTLVTSCAIDYNGEPATLVIIEDLTAEKEYQRMLESTVEREREANQIKSRFLVNMSHEIRTPMNAIIGLTEIELRKKIEKEAAGVYKRINNSAKNLLDIINDILDLSKIEAGKMDLFSDEFSLEDAISDALLVVEPRLDGKNVELVLNASLDLPRFVIGDRTRLWQVLKNFLDNSAKYTEQGKVVLTVFVNDKQSDEDSVWLTFIIEDTGIGIEEEQMQKLFLPYEQVYSDAQKRYTGTGLGLAISKQLCELMGGNMEIESEIGTGTSIHVDLPFRRSKNTDKEINIIKTAGLQGIKILAVDDDELSLSIMCNIISGSGASCVRVCSGEEAMQNIFELRDKGEAYDLILLDYMMDGLNGLETARQIQTGLSKAPKLLMVTAYQRLLLKEDLEKHNIADVIEKPFIPSHFISRICQALGIESRTHEEEAEVFIRFENVTVLLCEDYSLNQEVAIGMLEQFGIAAVIAENGRECIEILNERRDFDLIFMDLQMPVMDGYEATGIIRADKRFDHIPIISLTADAMKEVTDKCMEIGMNGHVAKPIEFASLQRTFMKWLPESKRVLTEGMPKQSDVSSNSALARLGGRKDRYEKALTEFAGTLYDEWPDFSGIASDMEEMRRYVHKIKGTSGNLSEAELFESCKLFESSLHSGSPDRTAYDRLILASNKFKRKVAELVKSSDVAPREKGTSTELSGMLKKLRDALGDYDLKRVSDTADSLKEKIWPSEYGEKLDEIYGFIHSYDYDSALSALEQVEVK